MENYNIINYEERFSSELKEYLKIIHSDLSDEYISFCVDNLVKNGCSPSLLVIDDKEHIVGCHLYFSSKIKKDGQEKEMLWGHETYLNKECRRYIGLDFVLRMNRIKGSGIGLSEVNTKIQNKLRVNCIDGLFQYIIPSYFVIMTVLNRLFKIKATGSFSPIETVGVKEGDFVLIQEPKDFQEFNNGYWCGSAVDVDFKRDREYIAYRYFNNVKEYYLYQLRTEKGSANCYFVVRPIIYKGFQMLSIVDYRYKMGEERFSTILKAAEALAKRNKIGALYLMSSDPLLLKNKRLQFFSIKWSTQMVSTQIDNNVTFLVTSAEADVDFLK